MMFAVHTFIWRISAASCQIRGGYQAILGAFSRLIQKTDTKFFDPVYLVEKGSTINWKPCGDSLQCEFPGVQFQYYPEVCISDV